jgi:hypothetical protein
MNIGELEFIDETIRIKGIAETSSIFKMIINWKTKLPSFLK